MRGHPVDRSLWLAILVIPFAAWILFEPPPAPTEMVNQPPISTDGGDSNTNPLPDRNGGDQRDVKPDSGDTDVSAVQTPVEKPRALKIRALSNSGELLPAGTLLPLENIDGPVVAGAGGSLEISTIGVRDLTISGSRFPLDLASGNWIIDCTFQQPSDTAPVQIPWLILARPENSKQSAHLILLGQTPLPPGSRLLVQLLDGENVLDGGILTTEGQQIWWNRKLVPRDWFATLLTVRFQWRASAATENLREQVAQIWQPADRGENWTWHGKCGVDDLAEAQRQSQEIFRWFSLALTEVETSRDLLLVAGAKARGKRAGLLRDDDRVDRMLDHPLAGSIDKLGRGQNFDFQRWRKLIDVDFPGRWQVWTDPAAVPWPDRNMGATKNIGLLFQTLNKYSRLESTVIYEQLGKPRHVHDFVADFDWDPVTERTQTLSKIRNFIASIQQAIDH